MTTKEGSILNYLNWTIIQSESCISIDKIKYIKKFTAKYFSDKPCKRKYTTFRTDKNVYMSISAQKSFLYRKTLKYI